MRKVNEATIKPDVGEEIRLREFSNDFISIDQGEDRVAIPKAVALDFAKVLLDWLKQGGGGVDVPR